MNPSGVITHLATQGEHSLYRISDRALLMSGAANRRQQRREAERTRFLAHWDYVAAPDPDDVICAWPWTEKRYPITLGHRLESDWCRDCLGVLALSSCRPIRAEDWLAANPRKGQ